MWKSIVLAATFAAIVRGSYVIMAPRKWTFGESSIVCLHHVDEVGRADDHLNVTVEDFQNSTLASFTLPIEEGQESKCYPVEIQKPQIVSSFGIGIHGSITFEGQLGEGTVHESRKLVLQEIAYRTFLQTDKYLYKPGQTVRFRILTLQEASANVYTGNYPRIYVEAPSGKRIKQWSDVDNSAGLVHLQFDLIEEAEEGLYRIILERKEGYYYITYHDFEVKDYVLPKFEVTVSVPEAIYGSDDKGVVRVCANYTFGKPVKGNATVGFSEWRYFFVSQVTKHKQIDGCEDFEFTFEEMDINGPYLHNQLEVVATVVEEGTGTARNSSRETIEIHRTGLKFDQGNFRPFAKPGLPTIIKLWVTKADGTKAAFEPVRACLKTICKTFTSELDGFLGFQIPPNALTEVSNEFENLLKLTALNYPDVKQDNSSFNYIMFESAASLFITPYGSPSNSSLFLQKPDKKIDCKQREQKLELDLMFSTFNQSRANITVQVISRGQIQYQKTSEYLLANSPLPINLESLIPMEPTEGVVTGALKIPIDIEKVDSSEVKVLVWYTRYDGEVVSDVTTLDLRECMANQVDMTWDAKTSEPGDSATLTLQAEPGSLCSFGVVDKSTDALSRAHDFLTLEGFLHRIKESYQPEWTFCQDYNMDYIDIPQFAIDMVLGSQIHRRKKRGYFSLQNRTFHRDALSVFEESGLFFISNLITETGPCFSRPLGYWRLSGGSAAEGRAIGYGNAPALGSSAARTTYSRETWLWDLEIIPATGRSMQNFTLPDIVTEWVGKTVCVHPKAGVGISGKSSIATFTPFFTELTLPPSVKRGEILPVYVSVYSYLNSSLPVKVVMANSGDFDILGEEGEDATDLGERSSCLEANDKVTHTIRIKLNKIGKTNLDVTSFVDDSFPELCESQNITHRNSLMKSIMVESDGFPREKTWSSYSCKKEMENNTDTVEVWLVESPSDSVEGSERAFVTATGEVIGDSLEGLERLVRMPYGNGENNMLLFAPNVYIVQYLKVSKKLSDFLAKLSQKYIKQGYENELDYRKDNGSFSAFTDYNVSGSTWLTAFVVKAFAQASHYISIDQETMNEAIHWLKEQQMESGWFQSSGPVFHRNMQGGVGSDSSSVALTAYVLIALLEAGESPGAQVIQKGTSWLMQQQETWSTYMRAITSYALALAQHQEAKQVLQQLLQESTESSSFISWHPSAVKSKELGMEIAGYALLIMMKLGADDFSTVAFKIVKWISNAADSYGGFMSTQDIVIALQGLAAFSSAHLQHGSDLSVTVEAEDLVGSFNINEENRIVHHYAMLPVLPTNVTMSMTGHGCAFMQVVLRYSVPDPEPTDAFSLRIETANVPDKMCITKYITACTSYFLPNQESTKLLLEVNLVSGYVPVKEDLRMLINNTQISSFHVDGRTVLFHIDGFIDKEVCAFFRVTRETDVEETKPGLVRVYDYFQPEFFVEKSYVFPPATKCHSLIGFLGSFGKEIEAFSKDLMSTLKNMIPA